LQLQVFWAVEKKQQKDKILCNQLLAYKQNNNGCKITTAQGAPPLPN